MLDVDGTLLDPAHRLSPANRAAVRRAVDAGVHVLLASGRSPHALRWVLGALGLDGPAIGFTGAVTFRLEDGTLRVLAEAPVALDAAETVWALAADAGIEVGWYTADGWRAAALGPGVVEEAESTDEPPAVDPALPAGAPPPLKLMCIAPPGPGRAGSGVGGAGAPHPPTPALVALRDALPQGVRGVFSHPRYLEVTAAGVDKAVAAQAALAELGVPLAAAAAIGDQENDVGMLRAAGTGVAMGNAVAAVLEVADRTTATNERDGVARAIDVLLG